MVFFISLLSFSVGTFVGKQVSDSEHRKIALEGEFKGEGGREIASEKEEHAEGGGKISDKEIASLTEEFVNKEGDEHHAEAAHDAKGEGKVDAEGYKTYAREGKGREIASDEGHEVKVETHEAKAPEHAEAKHAETKQVEAKHADTAHPSDAAHHAAEKIAEGKAPSDGETEAKKPAPAELPSVANSAVGKYTVQVASYATEKEAKDHAAKLKEKGFQAFYLSAKVNNKDWYRVLVGLFGSVKSADEYKAQLIKEGGTKAAYVQKIVQ